MAGIGCLALPVVLMIWMFWGLYSCNMRSINRAPEPLSSLGAHEVQAMCENQLKKTLKAPTTAKFPREKEPEFTGGLWMYEDSVDSQNSFGAMIRSQYTCFINGSTVDDGEVRAFLTQP